MKGKEYQYWSEYYRKDMRDKTFGDIECNATRFNTVENSRKLRLKKDPKNRKNNIHPFFIKVALDSYNKKPKNNEEPKRVRDININSAFRSRMNDGNRRVIDDHVDVDLAGSSSQNENVSDDSEKERTKYESQMVLALEISKVSYDEQQKKRKLQGETIDDIKYPVMEKLDDVKSPIKQADYRLQDSGNNSTPVEKETGNSEMLPGPKVRTEEEDM